MEALGLVVGGGQGWAFWASRDYWEDVKIMDESEAEQRKRERVHPPLSRVKCTRNTFRRKWSGPHSTSEMESYTSLSSVCSGLLPSLDQ